MKKSEKVIKIAILTLAFFLVTGLSWAGAIAYADCGSSHAKKDPHNMGRITGTDFQDMDADQSGGVSFEEFKVVFPRVTREGFARLDNDGSGQLNPGEWDAFKDAHKGMGSYHKKPETT
ncbi:MAG: hypothetical protein MI802_06565 [Desulfobacterales bacterium]|nr:hypothetical protein [Desulfobacterales bacterium]